MSLPVILSRESGERIIVNWDAVSYIAPAQDDEAKGSVIHFNGPSSGESIAIAVREGLSAIERLLQSVTRA
ncbi:MAG TPA: hypothetical protein VK821_16645 [Dehalococcoidia bacterium]|nr:hypothetical protein [Dehalococcoidia bacterium]